jgi:hypothetical protein
MPKFHGGSRGRNSQGLAIRKRLDTSEAQEASVSGY